ncbi:diaminopimelate epimerase [Allobaculum mucilyticum]|uniref:diaminopimelate epimerase n=1 Tax=Allobaculum mucilyticum TaxID=2834459 RepID=UPI001E4E941A|nr:diaminopimelate epimerase [Allobaculum mucilyticum]UNT97100.1 diaminopimelate epimerase [Allobaculum mucilyticum]
MTKTSSQSADKPPVQVVRVCKYHGLGNDFILLSEQCANTIHDLKDFIIQVCDRHTGIGADGLILARTHPFFMEYYNQDGSTAPMCGNGLRCLCAFLNDEHLIAGLDRIEVETLAGLKTAEVISRSPFLVRVQMGKAIDDPKAIDARADHPIHDYPLQIDGKTIPIDSFFMSTTHTIVYDLNAMGDIEHPGKEICEHPLFEKQTNVDFVHVLDRSHIEVQTYERGCGVTLACGTGVCASALDAFRRGLVDRSVDVRLKRGWLHIDIEEDESVIMSGPAEKILDGNFFYTPSTMSLS